MDSQLLQAAMTADDVAIKDKKTIFQGFFSLQKWEVRHRLFGGGWSKTLHRELFVRGPAVGAVLYDPWHDQIAMIMQFRIGALAANSPPWSTEIVAGIAEPGEAFDDVAKREITEETGLTVSSLIPICHYLVSPGGTDESMHLFCGIVDLSDAGGVYGLAEEGEDILVKVFDAESVFANLYSGAFANAPSLIALQWLQVNQQHLREAYSMS